MRHLRSILYALVLAPAVWVLTGAGLTGDLTARGRDGFAVESLTGLLLLVLAGTAYGILVLGPISPAGPLAAGLVYLAIALWAMLAPAAYAAVWPAGPGQGGLRSFATGVRLGRAPRGPLDLYGVERAPLGELRAAGPAGDRADRAVPRRRRPPPVTPIAAIQTTVIRACPAPRPVPAGWE